MSYLDQVVENSKAYLSSKSKEERKSYGQFFTSKESAQFMASLVELSPQQQEISILDPGAGSGILSVALIERILTTYPQVKKITLTCYENNLSVLPLLQQNLELLAIDLGRKFSYHLLPVNYLLQQGASYQAELKRAREQNLSLLEPEKPNPEKLNSEGSDPEELETEGKLQQASSFTHYDVVICNPPYLKLNKEAPEVQLMHDICYGSPNLYFLFMEMARCNLKPQGQMVFIIPRSWTSGAYFKKFRDKFLPAITIQRIHLFQSRAKIFKEDKVLQETMIIKADKKALSSDLARKATIMVSTSSNSDFAQLSNFKAPYQMIVNPLSNYLFLVSNQEEAQALAKVQQWEDSLISLGLKMKTGLVVNYRHKELLKNSPQSPRAPLFYAQHLANGKVNFPLGIKEEYIEIKNPSLIQANQKYLFVKRFTSKEEARRLQCALYLPADHPPYQVISTDNKINFITGLEAMPDSVAYGLYVFFNSSLYDLYYRILNGSTQVNASEVNNLPLPPLAIIKQLGLALQQQADFSTAYCDKLLNSIL